MSVKKDVQPLSIDAAVQSAFGRPPEGGNDPIYGRMGRVRRARNMTKAQQKKLEKDAQRVRAMFDVPQELLDVLEKIASDLSVPKSQVAGMLMLIGLEQVAEAESEGWFNWEKEVSRSMRFEYNLVLPELPEPFRNNKKSSK